jgi:hypothetical protein
MEPFELRYGFVLIGGGKVAAMDLHNDPSVFPPGKAAAKRSNLTKDDRIKQFWETLVEEWLNLRPKKLSKKAPSKNDGSRN